MITIALHIIANDLHNLEIKEKYINVMKRIRPFFEKMHQQEEVSTAFNMFTIKIYERDIDFFNRIMQKMVAEFLFLPKDSIVSYRRNQGNIFNWVDGKNHSFEELTSNDFYKKFEHD